MYLNFRLCVLEANAQRYEDLFVKIMGAYKNGFQPVRPHGNIGDRGNDGWIKDEGIYYQVYAPEDVTKNSTDVLNKAKADFIKLKKYWDKIAPLKEYYFVVNDKYQGVGPHISKFLEEIRVENGLDKTGVILAQDLQNFFHDLKPEQKISIIPLLDSQNVHQNIYKFLADQLIKILDIPNWVRTSENLIANAIQDSALDNFYKANLLINKTQLSGVYESLNNSIIQLGTAILDLAEHFSGNLVRLDSNFYRLDKSWRQKWVSNFDEQSERDTVWMNELYRKHNNFVYSFNVFAENVRKYIQLDFYNGQVITIVDSLGVYNEMVNSEYLPDQFIENPL